MFIMRAAAARGIVFATFFVIVLGGDARAERWVLRDNLAVVFTADHSLAFACQRGWPVVIFTASGKQAGIFTEGVTYPLEIVASDGAVMTSGGLAADHNTLGIRFRGTMPAMFVRPVTIRIRLRSEWHEFRTPSAGAARAISDALAGCSH